MLSEMRQNIIKPESLPAELRPACKMCNSFTPPLADITLGFFGVEKGIFISLESELAQKLGVEVKETPGRQETATQLLNSRTQAREQVFAEFQEKAKTIVDFADCLDTCTLCYACSSACPICYCRVCFFRRAAKEDIRLYGICSLKPALPFHYLTAGGNFALSLSHNNWRKRL